MLRIIRKHNKWLMVAFGILLMVAWSSGPAIERIARIAGNRVVATIDGEKVRISDFSLAHQELTALERFVPVLLYGMGVEPRDSTHWVLLTREAEAAGLIGSATDGREFIPQLAEMRAQWELQRLQQTDPQEWIQYLINEELRTDLISRIEEAAPRFFQDAHMNEQQMHEALAKLRGVVRLVMMHNGAARFSDRHAIVEAKLAQDSAIVDHLVISAADMRDQIPEPTPEELQAHFEEFKETRPGEGEYGIGYLLPARAKLEWLKLDRAAIEQAVKLDPVEVSKRHMQQRSRYPGEFAEERAAVEADMRRELVDRAMQAAHSAIHAEVLSATRRLEQHGRYRRLPENWEEIRPSMEAVATKVVQAVGLNDGPSIPLPEVHRRADRWLTRSDITQIEDLGQSFVRRGDNMIGVDALIFSAREFENPAASLPVQAGVPQVDHFLTDFAGNRYYLTVLAARKESAPDSVDEIRETAVRDFKTLAAYRQLQQQASEFQSIARQGGLEAVSQAVARPSAQPLQIRRAVRVSRDSTDGSDAALRDPAVRSAIVDAAANIDPFTPAEEIPAEYGRLAIPSDRAMAVAVVSIIAKAPLTIEDYRRAEQQLIATAQTRELQEASEGDNPFSLAALLRRHAYVSNGKRIEDPSELRTQDEWEAGADEAL